MNDTIITNFKAGQRYALRWKHPHRMEGTVLEVGHDFIVMDVTHRCDPECELLKMRGTLSIEGRMTYLKREFDSLWVPMAQGALALEA